MTGHFKTIIWRRGYGTDQGEPESKGPVQIVDAVYRAQELSISGIAQELGLKAVNGYLKSSLAALVADLTKTEIVASQADVPVPMDIRPLISRFAGGR